MVIRKRNSFYSVSDDEERAQIFEEFKPIADFIYEMTNPEEEREKEYKRGLDLLRRVEELEEKALTAYIKHIEEDPEQLDRDIDEILDNITHEDFLENVKSQQLLILTDRKIHPEKAQRREIKDNPGDAMDFLLYYALDDQAEVIKALGLDPTYMQYAMVHKTLEWYPAANADPGDAREENRITFAFPRNHLQPLTKASENLFTRELKELEQLEFDITPHSNKVNSTLLVNVDISAPELEGTDRTTPFDRSVHDSVVSIVVENPHKAFTSKQVAIHLLYGNNKYNNNPSPQFVGAVTKSLDKQSLVRIRINWTDHALLNGYNLKDGDSFTIENYMLPMKKCELTINGQTVRGYRIIDTPPLYEYADAVNQIARYDSNILKVPGNLDQRKIIIRDFLLREIGHITNNKKWNHTISIDRIIEEVGDDPTTINRDKRSRLVSTVKGMLDYWRENKTKVIIKGYTINRKGRRIVSVTIDPVKHAT